MCAGQQARQRSRAAERQQLCHLLPTHNRCQHCLQAIITNAAAYPMRLSADMRMKAEPIGIQGEAAHRQRLNRRKTTG